MAINIYSDYIPAQTALLPELCTSCQCVKLWPHVSHAWSFFVAMCGWASGPGRGCSMPLLPAYHLISKRANINS